MLTMFISCTCINGLMLGIEHIVDDAGQPFMVIDLLLIRVIIGL